MSGYYRQTRTGGDAARQLRERLAREEMGDAAWEKHVSHHDGRAFSIFGVVFIVGFAAVVLCIVALGY